MPLDFNSILKCCWRCFVDGYSWTRVRFPNGGLFCVVRDVQELPQEPCFYLISKSSRGNSPSLPSSPRGSFYSFSFHCIAKGKTHSLALWPRPRSSAALLGWLSSSLLSAGSRCGLLSHQPGTRSQTTRCMHPGAGVPKEFSVLPWCRPWLRLEWLCLCWF